MKELKTLKLKTLKDFKLTEEGQGLVIDWLKAEAIKWVKYCPSKCSKHFHPEGYFSCVRCAVLIDFFNLTEEELK